MAIAIGLLGWGWFKPVYGEENLLQTLGLQANEKRYADEVRQPKKNLTKDRR